MNTLRYFELAKGSPTLSIQRQVSNIFIPVLRHKLTKRAVYIPFWLDNANVPKIISSESSLQYLPPKPNIASRLAILFILKV
jgi:hypothetical protein